MKVFYVRVQDSEFTKVDGSWVSPVIDLYDNSTFKNYSSTKAGYGLDLLGDGTWTGMEEVSSGVTDSGFVDGTRFVDTSARVDLVSYVVNTTPSVDGIVSFTLDVYSTDDVSATPTWAVPVVDVTPNENIDLTGVDRYVYFRLGVTNQASIPFEGELLVRVEVDRPVMAPLYRRTRTVLDKFPEWMAMREVENIPATPELAVPTSVGGAFLNAAGGEWLEQIAEDLRYLDLQKYIGTADLNQVAWVYRKDKVPQYVWSVVGDGVSLTQAYDLEEFYDALEDEDVYWWDETTQTIYTRRNYTLFSINEEEVATPSGLEPHHVWNWLDDLGLLVDLRRIFLEDNQSFQLRILDVHINHPGSGVESFKRALRRELDIWAVYGSTPNSSYLGATPEVLEVSDIEEDPLYITPEGLPTDKFIRLVSKLAEDYPTTWGYFYWDRTFWDIGGPKHEGYSTLPNRYDATPLLDSDTQSGVGFGNDLFVFRPDVVTGPRQFEATLKVRGRQRSTRVEHTKVEFDVEIWGRADKEIYDNPEVSAWLTLELHTTGSDVYVYSHLFTATSDADHLNPNGTFLSYSYLDLFDADGVSRLPWRDLATGELISEYATPVVLTAESIDEILLYEGRRWADGVSADLTDMTAGDTFEAWFSDDDAEVLNSSATPVTVTLTSDAFEAEPTVVFKSLDHTPVNGTWESEKFTYHIELNGKLPDQDVEDFTLPVPPVVWDPFLAAVPNKKYVVQIVTFNEDATPLTGAYALADDDSSFFIDDSYLELEGSAVWSSGQQVVSGALTDLTFSTADGAEYPIDGSVWTLFENSQLVPFNGIADESGPWRNNVPPRPGNTNYNWMVAELERSDFGIPDTTDYVPTWVGVESSDPQIIVWLENNTIVPYEEPLDLSYPANAIEEYEDGGVYGFESFMVKARLRPDPGPQWNPQVHSGWFYEQQKEYYLYASRREAVVTGADSVVLSGVAHQGAPIIVYTDEATPKLLRRVAFHDATPSLTLELTETIQGNGTDTLYLSYPDVKGVSVVEHHSGDVVSSPSTVASNQLVLGVVSDRNKSYDVTYTLNDSFYAEMNYDDNGVKRTRLVFDEVGDYVVSFEGSVLNPATPVDLPLSPLYTSLDEGFIYISHNEYTLDAIEVYMSPSRFIANGTDYIQVTIRSVDSYGNPKGNQSFSLSTDFGTLDKTNITTDRDGFAVAILTSSNTPPVNNLIGTLSIAGDVSADVSFEIEPMFPEIGRLMAITSAEEIPADGESEIYIFGKVEDADYQPVAGTDVYYRKGRSMFELFQAAFDGSVVTNSDGTFEVGPFVAATPTDPGYWFVGLETDPNVPADHVGDVVFWNEYPMSAYGIDDLNGLPRPANQMATPVSAIPPYAATYQFPFTYDEHSTPIETATPIIPNWLPPRWYSLPWYLQYQLGLFGATPNHLAYNYLTNARRPREDL